MQHRHAAQILTQFGQLAQAAQHLHAAGVLREAPQRWLEQYLGEHPEVTLALHTLRPGPAEPLMLA